MDWTKRNEQSFSSELDRLHYETGAVAAIRILHFSNPEQVVHEFSQFTEQDLQTWIEKDVAQEDGRHLKGGIRLIITNRITDTATLLDEPGGATLSRIPLSRELFIDLITQFRLSHSFIRTILRGASYFSAVNIPASVPARPLRAFNMRMGSGWSRDLTMSATANIESGLTCAIIHGCDQSDVELIHEWLRIMEASVAYPLLLPALFAELQLRRHKTMCKKDRASLMKLYANTGQYDESMLGEGSIYSDVVQDDYDSMTKEVIRLHQRAGFLEQALSRAQKCLKQMVTQTDVITGAALEDRTTYTMAEGARLRDRLEEMMDEYDDLKGTCKIITDGASVLIAAIFNLIAQRDNSVNQSIAADSRELAAAAKRDGSAMKTIAVLTLIFLPGTFVAAFFAMPLLDWQAPQDQSIVSNRFWIYWAVTLPLTAAVLVLWSTWYFLLGPERGQTSHKMGAEFRQGALQKGSSRHSAISLPEVHNYLSRLRQPLADDETVGAGV